MLSKFEIALKDSENDINRNMGSLFHGALMEMMSRDYGDYLHWTGRAVRYLTIF